MSEETLKRIRREWRWLKSKAYVSSVDHYAEDKTQTNRWTITFTSSCSTIDNAIKQAMKLEEDSGGNRE